MFNNKFIVAFEGIDGSGKTSQVDMLYDYLSKEGFKCRQIGMSSSSAYTYRDMIEDVGFLFKDYFNEDYRKFKSPIQIYELMRYYYENFHLDNEFEIIIADRYIHSMEWFLRQKHRDIEFDGSLSCLMNKWLPNPDIVFYFNIDVETALSRILARKKEMRKHESGEALAFALTAFEKIFAVADYEYYSLNGLDDRHSLHKFVIDKVNNATLKCGFSSKS